MGRLIPGRVLAELDDFCFGGESTVLTMLARQFAFTLPPLDLAVVVTAGRFEPFDRSTLSAAYEAIHPRFGARISPVIFAVQTPGFDDAALQAAAATSPQRGCTVVNVAMVEHDDRGGGSDLAAV